MKAKTIAMATIVVTAASIGTVYLLLNNSSNEIKSDSASVIEKKPDPVARPSTEIPYSAESKKTDTKEAEADIQKDEPPEEQAKTAPSPTEKTDLSQEDVKKIKTVVALNDQDLAKQIADLKSRIDKEKIFEKLEDGDFTEQQEKEAKEILEKFALLGLEETRRRFMNMEPELKDPMYAHRESLKEIRELLEDE
ncbi:MAG TPA: hypothetical protein VEL47_07990 [Myxococcota bacterium]|nr:hypothetical protein [Myxococcota bacterium]